MTDCQLSEAQIQAWLDGEADSDDCPQCQQRLAVLQKVRSRLAPPPSPLGKDFARRTAEKLLRVERRPRQSTWDNPVVHVAARERTRRLTKTPGLVLLFVLYLAPGWLVSHSGDADTAWAFFGSLQLGLTVLVPLFLLSLEWTTLSALVRGRCLEEMLQTGLAPALVSDTLALNGLRALAPAVGLASLALLGLQPAVVAAWLPVSLGVFVSAGYLGQAHLLAPRWPRWLSLLGLTTALAALGGPWWLKLWAGAALAGLALYARRTSVGALTDQQQGRPQNARVKAPGRFQNWLSRRLPDEALLQRELRRRSLWSGGWLLGCLGCLLGANYLLGWESMFLWPGLVSFGGSVLVGFYLLSREKQSGGYEVLLQSGLRQQDWASSAAWLACLQAAPLLPFFLGLTAYHFRADGPLVLACEVLATLCALLVSLWAGALIGSQAGLLDNVRQASLRCVREGALVAAGSVFLLALVVPMLGRDSVLNGLVRVVKIDPDQFLRTWVCLPGTLVLYLRASWLRRPRPFSPALPALAAGLPVALWVLFRLQGEAELANWYAVLAAALGALWMWWMAPRADRPGLLLSSYLLCLGLGMPVSLWLLAGHPTLWPLLHGLPGLNAGQLLVLVLLWSGLVRLLHRRLGWRDVAVQANFAARTALVTLAGSLSLGLAAGQILAPLPPAPALAVVKAPLQGRNAFPLLDTEPIRNWAGYLPAYLYWYEGQPGSLQPQRWGSEQAISDWMGRHSRELDEMMRTLKQDRQISNRDELNLISRLCRAELAMAVEHKQNQRALAALERLSVVAAHPLANGQQESWELRAQLLLVLRNLQLSESELAKMEHLHRALPPEAEFWQRQRERQAYQFFTELSGEVPDSYEVRNLGASWLGRIYLRQQANRFLRLYAGQEQATAGGLAEVGWRRLRRDREADQARVRLLDECFKQLLRVERHRARTGAYPPELPGTKSHYVREGDGYRLTLWQIPLRIRTDGPGFRLW